MDNLQITLSVIAAFSFLGAYTERKDAPRCVGMALTGVLMLWFLWMTFKM